MDESIICKITKEIERQRVIANDELNYIETRVRADVRIKTLEWVLGLWEVSVRDIPDKEYYFMIL